MENLLEILKTEDYLIISCLVNVVLIIVTVINNYEIFTETFSFTLAFTLFLR